MRRLANTLIVLLLMLCVVRTARAEPAWGVNCLSCHGEWQVGTLSVFGHDAVADPDESITGAPDRGPLPVFRVVPGQTGTLQAEVVGLDTGDAYAVELKRLRFPGVVTGGALDYADDCDWAYWGEPGKYYTDPAIGYSWGSGPATFTFDIGVNYDTPEDYYDLAFSVVGRLADGSGLFCGEEHFYLQVTSSPMIGDFDGDGDVDWDDFSAFVACFTNSYGRIEAGCEPCDLDDDDDIDCADWTLFRQAWTDPDDPPAFAPCANDIPTVSEWGLILMALLLATAGTFVLRRQRILVVTLSLAFCCVPAALATDLNVTLEADGCEASTITVGPACEITYRVIGELSDAATGGLAVVVFDLEFDGGALPQADEPTELPMLSFVAPNGFCSNPSGYGGTPQDGKLIQVGGAQNVFNHGQWACVDGDDCPSPSTCDGGVCAPIPGLPVGTLITDIAEPGAPVVLVTGTLTAPSSEGTYTLQVTNLTVNLVRQGATGDPFWETEAAGVGAVTKLLVTVQDGAPCCGQVPEACCLPNGGCSMTYADDCADQLGGAPQGPGSTCEDDDDHDGVPNCAEGPTIPTVSQWGLVVLALLLLAAGKVYFGRRLRAASLRKRG